MVYNQKQGEARCLHKKFQVSEHKLNFPPIAMHGHVSSCPRPPSTTGTREAAVLVMMAMSSSGEEEWGTGRNIEFVRVVCLCVGQVFQCAKPK